MFKKIFLTLIPLAVSLSIFSIPLSASSAPLTVTPEQFGADGFDSRPDTEAMRKAFNSGAHTVFLKEGSKYIIDKRITINQSIRIVSGKRKASIIQHSDKEGILYFKNASTVYTKAAQKIVKGSSYISVQSSKGIKQGDIVELKSSKLWKWDNRNKLTKGELHTVKSVKGNKVYFSTKTDDAYTTGKDETVKVSTYSPRKIVLENVDFTYAKPSNTTAIIIDPSKSSRFQNISIKNSKLTGLKLIKNVNAEVSGSSFDLGTTKDVSTGYGIQDYGGIKTKIVKSTFERVRRGVDFSGDIPSRYGLVDSSKAFGPPKGSLASGNSGFGTHSTAENIVFKNNYVKNFDYHFVSRGDKITFKNNTGTGITKAFMHTNYGDHITVANNTYISENKSRLEYFILRSNSFKGSIKHYGNKGLYQTYLR
ncbi:right-handed parallel beta-helix repeat-containing protein [Cytobacillus firmus]|uniref:right-handed parallel beta-helix repeat-containing protein n=1 Tax=Cytobacillus firmus TaxID=1399 RepID=UPI00384CD838